MGWLYLALSNTGGATNNFALGVALNGAPPDLAALGCPSVPGALGAHGGSGTSYTCVFPKESATTGTFDFLAITSATNAIVTPGKRGIPRYFLPGSYPLRAMHARTISRQGERSDDEDRQTTNPLQV